MKTEELINKITIDGLKVAKVKQFFDKWEENYDFLRHQEGYWWRDSGLFIEAKSAKFFKTKEECKESAFIHWCNMNYMNILNILELELHK